MWLLWFVSSCMLVMLLGFAMLVERSPAKALLVPGQTSHGHYQIEMACHACHTPMMGVKQDACLNCHADELKAMNDTHSAKKFNDPTKAEQLVLLNAKECITCHREHVPHRTHSMGLSLPPDYCVHCHQEIMEQRPSHAKFTFASCATSGCHNYHDNTALYENFLAEHWGEPELLDSPSVLLRDARPTSGKTLSASEQDARGNIEATTSLCNEWSNSAHAKHGVNCSDCHVSPTTKSWSEQVDYNACKTCHETAVAGFLKGKHGMRLSQSLSPMSPEDARLPMKNSSKHRSLDCSSCHSGHAFDTNFAAVDACLQCHNDKHSIAYKNSIHYQYWQAEQTSDAKDGTGVSCATCHLPRLEGKDGVFVEHNQNSNLRPNEKMIRTVCQKCHGTQFSLDALTSRELIDRCFEGRPTSNVESIEMAKNWFDSKRAKQGDAKKDSITSQPERKTNE